MTLPSFISTIFSPTPSSSIYSIPIYKVDQDFKKAAGEQEKIGWKNIFKGHLSNKWAHLQMKYFCRMYRNPPSLYYFSKNIILQLYDISYKMWEHRNNVVYENFKEALNKKHQIC